TKLEPQNLGPYYIHDVLPNGVYKLRMIDALLYYVSCDFYKKPLLDLSLEKKNKEILLETMDPVETSSNIQKTLALLKSQMEKASLEGTYMVSSNSDLYFTDQQTQIIQAEGPKCESDGQRLRQRMPEFLHDIRRSGISSTSIKAPPGDT
ncbi:12720_t:CDS:2, partial [Racocetra fulgida]